MNIEELYSLGRPIPKELKDKDKYLWLAFNGILEMKYLDVNDIFNKQTLINNFVVEYGPVLLIPNFVDKQMVDLIVKSVTGKKIKQFNKANMPYNIGKLNNFKYGDPLVIVEGVADLGGLKLIDPEINVVALKTNTISKAMYSFYESITDNIIIMLDADETAKKQTSILQRNLGKLGIRTTVIEQYGSLKDTGEIVELIMSYQKTKDASVLSTLNNINLYYKSKINLIKSK